MAQNIAMSDKCFDTALEQYQWRKEDLHLKSYDELRDFRNTLVILLRNASVDSSFEHNTSTKYKIPISGNANGIVSSYLHKFVYEEWKDFDISVEELLEYLNDHPEKMVLKSENYPGNEELSFMDRERFIKSLKLGSQFKNHGYGSQSYSTESVTKVKTDKDGNILIDHFVMIWD